jgi:hypothetical protein
LTANVDGNGYNFSNVSTIETTGNISVANILPLSDNLYTLGTNDLRWANVHIGPGSLYITDSNLATHNTAALTVTDGVLFINGIAQIQAPGITNGNTTISLAPSGNITFNAIDGSAEMSINSGNVNILGNLAVITSGGRNSLNVNNSGLTSVYAPTTILSTQSALSLIGTTSGNTQPRNYTGTMLQITAQDGQSARVSIDSFGNAAYPSIAGRAALGTVDAPSAVKAGNILTRYTAQGFGSTTYQSSIVRMDFQAQEDFTDTNAGTEIVFWATPVGGNTIANVVQITGQGLNLSAGKYITFSDGSTQSTAVQQSTGVWTPALTFSTSQGSQIYTTQAGTYIKTGQLVVANFEIVTSSDSGTGNVSISGLPFASQAGSGYQGSLGSVDYASATIEIIVGMVASSATSVNLYSYYTNASKLAIKRSTATDFGAVVSIAGTITYVSAT